MNVKSDDVVSDVTLDRDFPVPMDRDAAISRFKEAMRHVGTLEQVSAKSGVPKGTVENLLRGVDVRWTAAFAIAAACNVSLDWLATGRGQKAAECSICADEQLTQSVTATTLLSPREKPPSAELRESSTPMRPPPKVESDILVQAIEIVCTVLGQDITKDAPPKLAKRIIDTYEVLTGARE